MVQATIPEVVLTAADYSFTSPASIAGGLTRVRLTNSGAESHHAQFLRLNESVTVDQFTTTLQSALQAIPTEGEAALGRIFAVVTFEGGPATTLAGQQGEAVVDLKAGQYVLVCFAPDATGVPHLAKGMVQPLTVAAAPATRPPEPTVKATVDLNNFAFTGFPAMSTGKTTLKLMNKGTEPHEMGVVRLKGITAAQFLEILSAPPGGEAPSGPPPFEDAGGFQAMMPGETGWAVLDLTPGEYALICFVPSPANEFKPHVALGMFYPFTVK
ncbi:MAG: hypothetical protein HY685_06460 [Chloroflexi bacterium]|nr:hypothetical protein [Chloroflexota bacterium]